MMLTSSLIILAPSFLTIVSAVVLRQLLPPDPCFPAVFLRDPTPNLAIPAIVSVKDGGGWKLNTSVGGVPVTNSQDGGDKIRIALAVNDPQFVIFVSNATRGMAIKTGDGNLLSEATDETARNQMFKMDCVICGANDRALAGSILAGNCTVRPADDRNICVTSEGDDVALDPCAGSIGSDQLFNVIAI